MIVVRLTSGLGNQLFQYAAGRALASVRGVPLALDTSWFRNGKSRETHERLSLQAYVPDWREVKRSELCWVRGRPRTSLQRIETAVFRGIDRIKHGGRARYLRYVRDWDFSFNPEFYDLPTDAYLDGNWQSEHYFAPAADQMKGLVNGYQPPAAIRTLGDDIAATRTAFVHVRRGDYITNPHFAQEIGALSVGYYRAALEALRRAVGACRLIAFTNDQSWVSENLSVIAQIELVPSSIAHTPQDILYLMSRCEHAIIANSSLSWWGAWLGAHAKKQFVAAPKPWFADSWRNARDLIPNTWVTLPR
jgi:hypothetical protein